MRKLLELNENHFITGISLGSQFQRGGLFWKADGINPLFGSISDQLDAMGILMAGETPTDLTGAVVVDVIQGMVSIGTGVSTMKLLMQGAGGNFYQITAPDGNPTNLRSGANVITNPAIGMAIYKGNALYAQLTQIGTWNMAGTYPTGWTDEAYTGLESTIYHQMHAFKDRVYCANLYYIAMLPEATSGAITNAIEFSSDYRVNCLGDDGQFLIIGITQNTGDNIVMGKTKVCFWDTFDPNSWQREWEIPEPNIIAILRDEISNIAICGRGVYRFAYDMRPQKVLPALVSGVYPYGATMFLNMACWGAINTAGSADVVNAYGSPTPTLSPVLIKPFAGMTGSVSAMKGNVAYARLYVATTTPKLYRFNLGGTAGTSVSPQTVLLNLGTKYNIQKITITFAKALASGDSLNLDVASDYNATPTDWGTYSYATHGAVQEVSIPNSFKAKLLSLIFNFNGGAIKIRRVQIYGNPDPAR